MEKVQIPILSYMHEGAKEPYSLDTLGKEFEITVPPENILMGICAHHEARRLIEEGVEASILTIGGCAVSNMRVIQKINELTEEDVPVQADDTSNSIASNIESLTKYDNPFIIICQKYEKLRTYIHSNYHLKGRDFKISDWETYIQDKQLSDFEQRLIQELETLKHIPLQRKIAEGILTMLAYIDPKDGCTKSIALVRQKLRQRNPQKNIFNKSGLS